MCGKEDLDINNYFIDTAFPTRHETEAVLRAIGDKDGVSGPELEFAVNLRRSSLQKTLTFLEHEGAVRKDGSLWYLTPKCYVYPAAYYEQITQIRRRELEQMLELTRTDRCLSRFAVECLDDHSARDCGRCANCREEAILPGLTLSFAAQQQAAEFINALITTIEPRKCWPDRKWIGSINQPGICLSKYGDPGYGQLVKQGKHAAPPRFCDELVGRSAFLLKKLAQEHGIRYLTYVPSLRTNLVPDFAQRVAQSAGLTCLSLLKKTAARPQKEMENSGHQCRNAQKSFTLHCGSVPEKLILIDDIVDSRWTLTVCGHLLSERGCAEVYPFALADSSTREGS